MHNTPSIISWTVLDIIATFLSTSTETPSLLTRTICKIKQDTLQQYLERYMKTFNTADVKLTMVQKSYLVAEHFPYNFYLYQTLFGIYLYTNLSVSRRIGYLVQRKAINSTLCHSQGHECTALINTGHDLYVKAGIPLLHHLFSSIWWHSRGWHGKQPRRSSR